MTTQTSEYALRAVVFLALQSGEPSTAQEIANACRVSSGYMAKVLQLLGRAGLVTARRGLRGGFKLSRDADDITILDVLNVVQPVQRITCCPLGIEGHDALCPLHRRLDEAAASIESALGGVTITDLLTDPRARPLCGAADTAASAAKLMLSGVMPTKARA